MGLIHRCFLHQTKFNLRFLGELTIKERLISFVGTSLFSLLVVVLFSLVRVGGRQSRESVLVVLRHSLNLMFKRIILQ